MRSFQSFLCSVGLHKCDNSCRCQRPGCPFTRDVGHLIDANCTCKRCERTELHEWDQVNATFVREVWVKRGGGPNQDVQDYGGFDEYQVMERCSRCSKERTRLEKRNFRES